MFLKSLIERVTSTSACTFAQRRTRPATVVLHGSRRRDDSDDRILNHLFLTHAAGAVVEARPVDGCPVGFVAGPDSEGNGGLGTTQREWVGRRRWGTLRNVFTMTH